ncbi:tripartite tricarboxylate transporter TctB family protein [Marinobacter sp. BSs20148]|uniref:tripartite tricarboxylate transporter TctB family protein n=1 Tax=Marinobacter sp. BSs20148 TaxID=490759 RepID=UPI0002776935|nr:tripartite tricarboxylate transporter TctB family protein [Marinobacter sp. BSs20148]AFP30283.1 hypothetical protein MRBBS_1345 [Marinobacter sp. BSs20148]
MFIKIIKNHALTAIFCGLFFYLIYESIGFSIQARLFPLIIGIVGAVLTGIQLVRELRSTLFASSEPEIIKDDPGPGGDSDFAITESELTLEGRLRALEQFGWVAGLLLSIWLFGFYVGVPLLVGLYMLREKEKLKVVIPAVAGVALVVWGVFHKLISLPFPEGIVFNALGF